MRLRIIYSYFDSGPGTHRLWETLSCLKEHNSYTQLVVGCGHLACEMLVSGPMAPAVRPTGAGGGRVWLAECQVMGRRPYTHAGAEHRAPGTSQSRGFSFSHCSLTISTIPNNLGLNRVWYLSISKISDCPGKQCPVNVDAIKKSE